MNDWYQRMIDTLQLNGKGERTQQATSRGAHAFRVLRQNPRSFNRAGTLALEVMKFIRRFLQHVLPTGFMKIRYYGFLNPNCAVPLDRIRTLIEISYGFAVDLPVPDVEPCRPNTCPSCGGILKLRSALLSVATLLRWSG